ncbi:hypothetical protein, conserved [Eimeria maxima]|uniref:CBF1-interacting co-repressor CIR N-terminal domain-containing protein n=1 Tax=Eimeria maxima TaxID=5804 RepID=U6M3Z9_EIMMA|nr:hypothetical protein, conserved [Eimeria maxima]CDJ57793.1 hypothetical protein, conserved [Eimeria maxima]
MWIGNIGKKSAAFINHKPFHPGNFQNQEKVWLAEQKLKEEQKKEKELEERRREEVKIEELRRALRGEAKAALQLQGKEEEVSPAEELRRKAKEAARVQALQRKQQEAQNRLKKLSKSTLSAPCTANAGDGEPRTKKRKNKNLLPSRAANTTGSPAEAVDGEEEANRTRPADSSNRGEKDTDANFHGSCSKRRAREGGVAAYMKLLAVSEEGE